MSSNLQNILDSAITEFFSSNQIPLYDICYSSLVNYIELGQNLGQNL